MTEEPGSAERAEFRFNARASLSSALVAGRLAWLASPGWTTSALAMLCAAFMPTFQELDTVQALAGQLLVVGGCCWAAWGAAGASSPFAAIHCHFRASVQASLCT